MTKEQAEFINKAFEFSCEFSEIRPDYSGRGTMGETTFGVVVDDERPLLVNCLNYIKANLIDVKALDIPSFNKLRRDSMGRSTILY